MKKTITIMMLTTLFSLFITNDLFGYRERRGRHVIVKIIDGSTVRGELIQANMEKIYLITRPRFRAKTIRIKEINRIYIKRKNPYLKSIGIGAGGGFMIGVLGTLILHRQDSAEAQGFMSFMNGAKGGLIGLLAGLTGLLHKKYKKYPIYNQPKANIQAAVMNLKYHSRYKNY